MNLSTRILATLALVSLAPFAAAGDNTSNCQLQLIDADQDIEALICTPSSESTTTDGTGQEIIIEDPSIQRDVGSIGVVL
jgi:hypothetical protein